VTALNDSFEYSFATKLSICTSNDALSMSIHGWATNFRLEDTSRFGQIKHLHEPVVLLYVLYVALRHLDTVDGSPRHEGAVVRQNAWDIVTIVPPPTQCLSFVRL
jgi:hypothetical protein